VHREARLVVGDLGNVSALNEALAGVDAVVHFAGLISVAESVSEPGAYYHANVVKSLALLSAMESRGVKRIIFSSTCAVYGMPVRVPMDEGHPKEPINPYGATKRAFERALQDHAAVGRLEAVALRYFNAAGCHHDGTLGEHHSPEEHLIPRAIDAALGRGPVLTIHGENYETPDGTCIRDYIHVEDLAKAHVLALGFTTEGGFDAFNLGTERGHSVREVIRSVERVVGLSVPVTVGPRRPGDPPRLVAASQKSRERLGFLPSYLELDAVVETAVRWRREHPEGYASKH
jgi:UDP-glucose-4-epimerase GalE